MQRPTTSAGHAIPFWRQIRWQLILAFVLLAVVPMVIVAAVTNSLARAQARAQVFGQLESIADLKRQQIVSWLDDSAAAIDLLLSRPIADRLAAFAANAAPGHDEKAQANDLLRSAATSNEDAAAHAARFRNLFLYAADGRVLASADETQVGRTVSRQPYFAHSLAQDYVQPPYYALGSDELVVVVTHPLRDASGRTVAVLAGQLDLSILGQIMLARSGLSASGETYLVSQESRYLLTPSRFDGYPLTRAYNSSGIEQALGGENGAAVYDNYRDPPEQVMGVYRWVPELQAALLAEAPVAEALASAEQAQRISIGLMLGTSLVALLLGLLVATRLARPITTLTHVAARIAGGDLSQRATIPQRNEIGVLADGFNAMTTQLHQTLQDLEQRVAERTAELRQALGEREHTLDELRQSISARETLQATVRAMSSPVLPLLEGILVMPLIGAIDSERALLLMASLLEAVEQHRARVVLLDVTGVPLVDTQVAQVLLQAAGATRLLGAEPVLVGLRPELAQTIVGLGLDLSSLVTRANLQAGIRYATQRQARHDGRLMLADTKFG